ncbi:MAG: recombinase family protein [Candidatus Sulfotelmatobacter sp.]
MRAAIYARVSTKDQSCELQLRDLRAFCTARSFTLVREFVDVGESGAKDSRPQLNELMEAARKRQVDAVLVWRFDRFARSTKHLLLALEEFLSLGIQFISYQENIDKTTPLGQALFTIVSAVAQLERDLIRERVTAGIRNARACGKQLGRPRRIVNQEEVHRLRADGARLRQISEKLGVGYGTVRLRLRNVRMQGKFDADPHQQARDHREMNTTILREGHPDQLQGSQQRRDVRLHPRQSWKRPLGGRFRKASAQPKLFVTNGTRPS